MSSEDCDKWLAASQEEFDGLTEMGVWKLVDHPVDCKTIKCRWTYVQKANGRYKARLVAKGYMLETSRESSEAKCPNSQGQRKRLRLRWPVN